MILCKVQQTGGLGDVICASGALKKLQEKLNSSFFIETPFPSLFVDEIYANKVFDSFYNFYDLDIESFYQKFNKIYLADYHTENHLKSKTNIVESYCEYLNVEKTDKPFISVDINKFNSFNFLKDEKYILISLEPYKDMYLPEDSFSKHLSYNYSSKIITELSKKFTDYKIIDINKLPKDISNKKELLYVVMRAKSFVSVDGGVIHLASNEPTFKKGVCLYRNENSVKSFGYKDQVNLVSNIPLIGPYVDIEKIIFELQEIIKDDSI